MRALIVDDDELSLELLHDVLSQLGYEVERATNGKEALALMRKNSIHLVITDWEMPAMNGLELCRTVRSEDFDGYVFIIMLTSRDGGRQRIEGLHAGADAFLNKPLNPDELVVSLKTAERILGLETRDLAMFALAKLSESRDPDTGAHVERVQSYARLLAHSMSSTERYSGVIDPEFIRLIYQTSPLHDIGKVGIPDNVLLKPGKLNDQEMSVMRTHATMGAQTIEASLARFPNVRFLQMARDIAASHHERWDGNGYPVGLSGTAIPLAARIVALADVYDAITSRRVYRDPMSHAHARALILRERGAHFDPDVIDAFVRTEPQLVAIRERFSDDQKQSPIAAPTVAERDQHAEVASNSILVVDDDPTTRELIANFLHAIGLECITCGDGAAALELLQSHRSRIIISDWEMPGIDGLELCRRVRSAQGTYHVHFIMQTVHAGNDELKRAFDAGVDDFVRKPFTEGDLHSRLRAAMRSIALHDELARRNRGSQELNAQLTSVNQRLEMLAITDDLTGLYNRRQAMHRLEEDWAASHQLRRAISVVLIDIDHFKQINDLHGHAIGDFVLRRLADVLRGCLRATDIIARFGGEEFLIILPNQTQQEAEVCAQRCLHAVEKHPFDTEELKLRVTISAGIACRRSEMQQCSDLLAEADQALYAAKHAGRNTVRTARVDTPAPVSASSASTAA